MEIPECIKMLYDLANSVNELNDNLVDNMTNIEMKYGLVCVKPDLTYDTFFKQLKQDWEKIVKLNGSSNCSIGLLSLGKKMSSGDSLEDIVLDHIVDRLMDINDNSFEVDESLTNTMINLIYVLKDNCLCHVPEIFNYVMSKYIVKYQNLIKGMTKEDVKTKLKEDMNGLKIFIESLNEEAVKHNQEILNKKLSNKLTNLYEFNPDVSFSVDDELNKLIPDSLGSLKKFFITVIAAYYNNIHPVIWAQIIKEMILNLFKELPATSDEFFAFISKHALLNSGPYILKILQTIRPFLTTELKNKYNLNKLTYPQLSSKQINTIFKKVVKNWELTNVITNVSASVGHVCIVNRTDIPDEVFIIKIIKPLSIVQSCWEYKTLYNLYPDGTCESEFVRNMLESNGREFNVRGEISNLQRGYEYYTCDYRTLIGSDIDVSLTTVQNIEGIIDNDKCWYALTMTLAPGVPLSRLVENDLIENDTHYRAKLHRCLDLLVYKFFSVIIQHGFYHGDLHAGNVFFSFEKSQMTLIDFGAVGEIDLFKKDKDIRELLEIIIMSVFYNYDEMFDKMTLMLNDKCDKSESIDMKSEPYINMRRVLTEIKMHNFHHSKLESQNTADYKEGIFSAKRLEDEKNYPKTEQTKPFNKRESIYTYMEYTRPPRETETNNETVLPQFSKVSKPQTVGFSKILENIFTFYASNGTNVAIKFNEFYEFQKAYTLLLGLLSQTGYSPFRTNIMLKKSMLSWSLLPKLVNVDTVVHLLKIYNTENAKYEKLN